MISDLSAQRRKSGLYVPQILHISSTSGLFGGAHHAVYDQSSGLAGYRGAY
jgi:hypothetical protein